MIFANQPLTVHHCRIRGNNVPGITLGGSGPGSKRTFIPVAKETGRRLTGLRKDLALGVTRSDRPQINHKKSADTHLFLSARPRVEEWNESMQLSATGRILVPQDQGFHLLDYGCGFQRYWSEAILAAELGDVFLVYITAMGSNGLFRDERQQLCLVGRGGVLLVEPKDIDDTYRSLIAALGVQRPYLQNGFSDITWSDVITGRKQHVSLC